MENICQFHKSKAILFCIDDKCCKQSRLICSRCEVNNDHDGHQLELIEDIPKQLNKCLLQDFPQERLIASTNKFVEQIQNRINNLLYKYKEQLNLYIKDECNKINELLMKGRNLQYSNYSKLSVSEQELFIELVNNRISYDEIIKNIKYRQINLEQSLSNIMQTLQERLSLSSFKKIKTLDIQIEQIRIIYEIKKYKANLETKSFCMLNDEQIVFGEDDGCIKLIDIEKNTELLTVELKTVASNFIIEKVSSSSVAAYEKASYYIEIVDFNGVQGKNIVLLKNKDQVSTMKSIILGQIMGIGYQNGLLKIYNYKDRQFLHKIDCNLDRQNQDISIECIDSLNNLIVVGGKSGFINVWDWQTGNQVAVIRKAFSYEDIINKSRNSNNPNAGRAVKQILFLNQNEILSKQESENSFCFHSLIHENQKEYPLNYINIIRFLQPSDFHSIIIKKPVFQIPLDFESFSDELSKDKLIFIQNDYRKEGRTLQIYSHSQNKVQFQIYLERNSQIVATYLTSKQLLIVYQDGTIIGYI